MFTQAKLAEFYGITDRSIRRLSADQRHRLSVRMAADVTPDEWSLIGEIMQLAYLYNAKGWVGEKPLKWCSLIINSIQLLVSFHEGVSVRKDISVGITDTNAVAQMELLKRQLEQLVYGGAE